MVRNTTKYVTVDLNSTGTTTLHAPTNNGETVETVELDNSGSTAVVQLEATDGTDTVVLTPGQTGGDGVSYSNPLPLDDDQTVQVNVTTAEGAALTGTAGVFVSG